MNNCYYEALGIPPAADIEAIRAAYRSLAQRFHPDKNPGCSAATSRMQQINEAYRVLSNSITRNEYDNSTTRDEYDDSIYKEPHFNSEEFVWARPAVRQRPIWKQCVLIAIPTPLIYVVPAVFNYCYRLFV